MSSSSSELRRRLTSVNKAEKLIDAMRLVAAARIRSSSLSALRTRPFAEKLQAMMASLLAAMERDGHDALHAARGPVSRDAYGVLADDRVRIDSPAQKALMDRLYLVADVQQHQARTVCLVVVGADKGFCGTYNRDINARALARANALIAEGLVVELVCVGKVAAAFFARNSPVGVRVREVILRGAGSAGNGEAAAELCDVLLTAFIACDVDRVEVIYTRFVSILSNAPSVRTLIPLTPSGIESLGDELFELTTSHGHLSTKANAGHVSEEMAHSNSLLAKLKIDADDAALLLNAMLPMYVNSQVTRILRESLASEHASRMTAMSAATDNARDLGAQLKQKYNRERQARITKEVIEVSAHTGICV